MVPAPDGGWVERSTRSVPRLPELSQRLLLRSLVAIHRPWITTRGADWLADSDDPLIFALNHNNAFESVGVPATLISLRGGRMIHFLVDWMYLHVPVVGWVMSRMGPVPVFTKPARWRLGEPYRQARRAASPVAAAVARLEAGQSIGIFPEGTRNPDPETLLRGRAGLGRIVLDSTAPVVPVGIRFEGRGRAPVVGRLTVSVGRQLGFADERRAFRVRAASGDGAAASRELGRRVVDRVMTEIAGLCGKRYRHAAGGVGAGAPAGEGLVAIGGAA